jgi:hypothetical protein
MSTTPTTHSSAARRRRAARLAAPIAGLLAAGLLVWQGSTAAFTAQTTNTGDAWSTGNLNLTNDGGTGGTYAATTTALFGETLIKPGSTGAKCINVRSTGNLPGTLKLYRGALSGTNATNLANNLVITVDATAPSATAPTVAANCVGYTGGTGGAVYNNTLGAFPTTYAAAPASGALSGAATQYVTYRIGWTMPATVTDNTLQSSSAQTDLVWEVQ